MSFLRLNRHKRPTSTSTAGDDMNMDLSTIPTSYTHHRQHSHQTDPSHDSGSETDDDPLGPGAMGNDSRIDPSLRLRTVRTAASTLAEASRSERRAERRAKKKEERERRRREGKGKGSIRGTLSRFSVRRKGVPSIVEEDDVSVTTAGAPRETIPETTTVTKEKDSKEKEKDPKKGERKKIFVNLPVPASERDPKTGEPKSQFVRNKVRTTKYTPITFLPKNLSEQFRRIANLFFLLLVAIQVFPLFGAAAPTISWLPLAFIIAVTAVKDGVEDYRRKVSDESVNNSRAVRLRGVGWRNPNRVVEREWWEKALICCLRRRQGKGEDAATVKGRGEGETKGVRKARQDGSWRVGLPSFDSAPSNDGVGVNVGVAKFYEPYGYRYDDDARSIASTSGRPRTGDSTLGRGTARGQSIGGSTYASSSLGSRAELKGRFRSDSVQSESQEHDGTTRNNSTDSSQQHLAPGHGHSYPPKSSSTLVGSSPNPSDADLKLKMAGVTHTEVAPTSALTLPGMPRHGHGQNGGDYEWELTLWKKLYVGDIVVLRENEQVPADLVVLAVPPPPPPSATSPTFAHPGYDSDEEDDAPKETNHMCFVETKNLDGETNLKPRLALACTADLPLGELVRKRFWIDSEAPNANLYSYNGVLHHYPASSTAKGAGDKDEAEEERLEAITASHLLLRGSTLRNTPMVIGLVLSTGPHTKIMLNAAPTPSKRSKIEKETNFNVIVNFVIVFALCALTAIVGGVEMTRGDHGGNTSRFLFETRYGAEPSKMVWVDSIITFASALIAFQNIIPISLYISIEIVKTIQAYFIHMDLDMRYVIYGPTGEAELDTTCVPKTWNISDDLGQIEYIFSDKTGTLTQNIMEFMRCSIGVGGERGIYGDGISESQKGKMIRDGPGSGNGNSGPEYDNDATKAHLETCRKEMVGLMKGAWDNRFLDESKVTLISSPLARDLAYSTKNAGYDQGIDQDQEARQRRLANFFKALALCHSVLPSHSTTETGQQLITYKAESPDEAALVSCARDVGFPFISRSTTRLTIESLGVPETYIPLKVLEFNSTRKRMSVILRAPDGRIILYCKGADSVIYERLAVDSSNSSYHGGEDLAREKVIKEQTARDMERFANEGLRTLCVAHRTLDEEEYAEWSQQYDAACAAIDEREEKMEAVADRIERGLFILGASALEDKLQEGVPDAIEQLHRAGIKLWILTGDKVQTAIEIGYSCNLLKHEMDVMILQADSIERTRQLIEAGLNKIASASGHGQSDSITSSAFLMDTSGTGLKSKAGSLFGSKKRPPMNMNGAGGFGVVIDGDTLRYALDPSIKPLFLSLGRQCDTVVCCRVSPAQKALTVKLVKDGEDAMTLAIGDGANDVAMIQEAHVGCGLYGLEGSQAAMSADYAFGQFRFLTKLLIVHGHWSYQRVADMHANFFYKNVIWTFVMFWFLFYNSFDATYLYEYTFILLYNLVFTSLPVIIMGAFDQDVNAKAALAFPQLYKRGILGLEYTKRKFWAYMLDGFYQSAIVYFVPYLAWELGGIAVSWQGKPIDSLADFGTTASVAAIFAANQYVGLNTRYWTVITWVVVFGSTLIMFVWIAIYSAFTSLDFDNEVIILYGCMNFWATLIISVFFSLLPRALIKYVAEAYHPLDRDLIREAWVKGDLKDRLGVAHRKKRKTSKSSTVPPPYTSTTDFYDAELTAADFNPRLRTTSEMSEVSLYSGQDTRGDYLATASRSSSSGSGRNTPNSNRLAVPPSAASRATFYSSANIPPSPEPNQTTHEGWTRPPETQTTNPYWRMAVQNAAASNNGSPPQDPSLPNNQSSNPYWRASMASTASTVRPAAASDEDNAIPDRPPRSRERVTSTGSRFAVTPSPAPLQQFELRDMNTDWRGGPSQASYYSEAGYDTATEGSDAGTIRGRRSLESIH